MRRAELRANDVQRLRHLGSRSRFCSFVFCLRRWDAHVSTLRLPAFTCSTSNARCGFYTDFRSIEISRSGEKWRMSVATFDSVYKRLVAEGWMANIVVSVV